MRDIPDVVGAEWLGGYRLRLRFDDGVEGEADLTHLLDFRGVFEPLRDPKEFGKVRVDRDLGTIVWPNGADVDPLILHELVTGRSIEIPGRVA